MARIATRDVPKLTLRAEFAPSTIDVEKRTVELTWTTGARVLRGFYDPYWEELSVDPKHVRMGRLQSGAAPLLNSHRAESISDVIGVVETASVSKGVGTARVRFDSGPEGQDAFRRVQEGTLRNVSVGYATFKMMKVEDGTTTTPVYRAVDWEPRELSLLAIGADEGAATRTQGDAFSCEFITEETRVMEEDETQTPAPATPAPAPQPVAAVRSTDDAAITAERERVGAIHRLARAFGRPAQEAETAVASGTSVANYVRQAADAQASAPPEQGGMLHFGRNSSIVAGDDEADKFSRCAQDMIYQRAGVNKMVIGDREPEPGECRGMTMVDLARECLQRAGKSTRGMDREQVINLAMSTRSNSTSDFPIILGEALHKTLLAAYSTTPDTWRRFCAIGSVTDFRDHHRYRMGGLGVLDEVGEHGEYRNASLPDGEKHSIRAKTKGRIVSLTRQALVNDDMGAFSSVTTRLGRAASLTIEVDVYKLLLANPVMSDGVALFDAAHGNIGSAAAISVASLDADAVLMASQKDPAGVEEIELQPDVLLVPRGLKGQAVVINGAQYDVDAKANARQQEPNRVQGMYRDIVGTSRLSGTTRYSFAAPSIAPVIEVVFLNGQQEPVMEIHEEWRSSAMSWLVRHDFGVGAIDWRGVVRNAGA